MPRMQPSETTAAVARKPATPTAAAIAQTQITPSERARSHMSTKSSIKYAENEFHLYSDVMDDMLAPEGEEPPVYLRLDDCEFEAYSRGAVVLKIKASTARKLGLLPPATSPESEPAPK